MTTPPAIPKTRSRWKSPLLIIGLVVLLILVALGVLWWWLTRPIKPVTLTSPEKQVLEQKIDALSGDPPQFPIAPGEDPPAPGDPEPAPPATPEPAYEAGSKSIILTQRELNGLLEMNGLGDKVEIILAEDTVITRVNSDIPEDFPMFGGQKFKARARFFVTDEAGRPALIVDDVTVWGISLPNAWLGEIKGENLFEVVSPELNENFISRGIEEIKVGNGQIRIDLAD